MVAILLGFPGGSEVKASARNAGDLGSICGLGRCPGEGNGVSLAVTKYIMSLTYDAVTVNILFYRQEN